MLTLEPCEREEDSPELADLRKLVAEYDKLFEKCMTSILDAEDQKTLDELHGTLLWIENARWGDEAYEVYEELVNRLDVSFQYLRYELGILSFQLDLETI